MVLRAVAPLSSPPRPHSNGHRRPHLLEVPRSRLVEEWMNADALGWEVAHANDAALSNAAALPVGPERDEILRCLRLTEVRIARLLTEVRQRSAYYDGRPLEAVE